jgi:hypothetical protein
MSDIFMVGVGTIATRRLGIEEAVVAVNILAKR